MNYYNNVDGVGSILKSQLRSAMSSGHIQRRYGDFRFSAAITDRDPNNSNNILLVYNGASVDSDWDSGSTWNREHVWPQSRQPGSASNSSTGNLGDPHALRPVTPSVNSTRNNKPFGLMSTIGPYDNLGTFWFPGDACKGDIARSLFYSDTRWSSQGLSLVNGIPSGNQMGDLQSLVTWHYLDPPDEFERRRNHTIYSSAFNPSYYTNNRNAFVDRPEFVWSIYVDQQNDSRIGIQNGSSEPNGYSYLLLDFGKVIRGTNVSTSQNVVINKLGMDGTYFSVEPILSANSEITGRFNSFRTDTIDSQTVLMSLDYDPDTADQYVGSVMIDNLDVTTEGGMGRGANDANDFVDLILSVVDHANGSFNGNVNQDLLIIDLGEIEIGQPIPPIPIEIHNLPAPSGANLTADLDFVAAVANPTSTFLSVIGDFSGLAAEQSSILQIEGTPDQPGPSATQFELLCRDEDIPGSQDQLLEILVAYDVIDGVLLGDVNQDGNINLLDVQPFVDAVSSGSYQQEADCNNDGLVNLLDVEPFVAILTG